MKLFISIVTVLAWPLLWLWRQLHRQVRLRRHGRGFRLVLEQAGAASRAAPPAATSVARPPAAEVCAAATEPDTVDDTMSEVQPELLKLLTQHQQARHLMCHLAYIERALRQSGAKAFEQVPLDVLKKALAQLEGLVSDWSSPGLAELRLRLLVAMADQEEAQRHFQPSNSLLSDFHTPQRLQVSDGRMSDFESNAKTWAASPPATAPASAASEALPTVER